MVRHAMIMDLRTCIGCRACMAACSMENHTPFWEMDLKKWRTRVLDVKKGNKVVFFSTICMHCENPPCVPICPTGASYRDTEKGVVLVNYEKCIGCGYCIHACPYDARYLLDENDVAEMKVRYIQPTEHYKLHVDKCTFCVHRWDNEDIPEELREPACVATCVGHARIWVDLDDPNDPHVKEYIESGLAKPLSPELGTHPRVYYVIPEEFKDETPKYTIDTTAISLSEQYEKPLKRLVELAAGVTALAVVGNAIKDKIKGGHGEEEETEAEGGE